MISKKNILNLKSRRDIYQFISKNPGLHINEICLRMNITRSTLRHHLKYLTKLNLIISKIDRNTRRLYAHDHQVGVKDQELLSLLRQKVPFKIIMYLLFPGLCSKIELAKELEVYPSIIDFHLKKLLDMGVIRPVEVKDGRYIHIDSGRGPKTVKVFKKPNGREIFYAWKNFEIVKDLYGLLITHKESIGDPSIVDTLNEFIEEWKHLHGHKLPKKRFCLDSTVDNFIDMLEEIVHFPFHF